MELRDSFFAYLKASDIIDFENEEIIKQANNLYDKDIIKCISNCFHFVRDKIYHIADIKGKRVVCKASEVLKLGYGDCCAKAHLLVALLRYHHIPSGFCYQKLILDDDSAPYLVIHGLAGVYVNGLWMRIDPRGNKEGVDAEFYTDHEQLAFHPRYDKGEEDIPYIYAEPDKYVIDSLINNETFEELWANLPRELYKR